MEHKHAAIIRAWADGKEIEFYNRATEKWSDLKKPMFFDDMKYRIKNKWQAVKDALESGKVTQYRYLSTVDGRKWSDWIDMYPDNEIIYGWEQTGDFEYRIKPTDNYKVYRDALGEGKTIQMKLSFGKWQDIMVVFRKPEEVYFNPEAEYRIKHKWDDVISAWGNGVKTQWRYRDYRGQWGDWQDMDDSACSWFDSDEWEYRIKPKERVTYDVLDTPGIAAKSFAEVRESFNPNYPVVRVVWNEEGTQVKSVEVVTE